jgi:DNA polymerase I-like protein with 3'-5' exonuclease and polymerase domains
LLVECPKEHEVVISKRFQEHMENPFKEPLDVKLEAIPSSGRNWAEAKH